jgi:hypothetical protein
MIVVENECVGCPAEIGCIGASCKYLNVERYYCDSCGDEGVLYELYGDELCIDCVAKKLPIVEGSDIYV